MVAPCDVRNSVSALLRWCETDLNTWSAAVATVLVTITIWGRQHDLEVPADTPIADMIAPLLEVFGAPDSPQASPPTMPNSAIPLATPAHTSAALFQLGGVDGPAFARERTLIQCGVVDGAELALEQQAYWRQRSSPQFAPVAAAPSALDEGDFTVRWNRGGLFSDA